MLDARDEGRAVVLFLAMGTQWRWAGMGERVGIDYGALETVARLAKVEIEPSDVLLADLRVMEQAALRSLRATAERDRPRRS